MYTIDMNSALELTALMIPRPGMSPVPLVRTSPSLFDERFRYVSFPASLAPRPCACYSQTLESLWQHPVERRVSLSVFLLNWPPRVWT